MSSEGKGHVWACPEYRDMVLDDNSDNTKTIINFILMKKTNNVKI